MVKSSCYNCTLRKPACHDNCIEYKAWQAKKLATRKAKEKDKCVEANRYTSGKIASGYYKG